MPSVDELFDQREQQLDVRRRVRCVQKKDAKTIGRWHAENRDSRQRHFYRLMKQESPLHDEYYET